MSVGVGQDGAVIRDAVTADAARCAAGYAPYVRETAISFEEEPPSAQEMARRIVDAQRAHAWLVLEEDDDVVGYAYGGPFMSRAAYQWSTGVSVYLAPGRPRNGGGRALYEALFDRLAARGHRTALAGIALPNEASTALHLALGPQHGGTSRRSGWKLGCCHDVAWHQRARGADDGPPAFLR